MAIHLVSYSPHVHQVTSLSCAMTVTCDFLVMLKGCKRELHTGTNKTMMCQLPIAC